MRTWITTPIFAFLIASATAGPGDQGCAPDREAPTPKVYARMQSLLRAGRPAFTGLFVDTDTTVPGVYKALTESGLRIPQDLSVIGYDGIPEGEYYNPPLTTISQDYRLWAQDTVRILRHRLAAPQSPPAVHAQIAPLLITRASTASRR